MNRQIHTAMGKLFLSQNLDTLTESNVAVCQQTKSFTKPSVTQPGSRVSIRFTMLHPEYIKQNRRKAYSYMIP